MSQVIDITARITNELPLVRITNELTVSVNNRKNTVMSIQAMINEIEKKAEKKGNDVNETDLMSKTIEMLVGAKSAAEIEGMDLPFPEYKLIYQALMAAATGSSMEEIEKRFQ